MPLKIRKQPNKPLYKVYDNGKPLSKKGMSMEMAERQKLAVTISKFRKSKKPLKPMV